MKSDDVDFHDTQHEWVSFEDADGDTWMFDLTFLTSNWTCVFGAGCPGVYNEPKPELQQGCCSFGSHFQDRDDVRRVRKAMRRLDDANWQFRKRAEKLGGPIYTNRSGETVTRVVEGACVFLNRPDFPGGPGCALHRGALEAGERPMDWKPGVCWQLPLRLESSGDDEGQTTYTLREWKRPDWGGGGEEFHWWCTDDPMAFRDREKVYKTLKDEIIEMVGPDAYEFVAGHIERSTTTVMLPHPALRRKGA